MSQRSEKLRRRVEGLERDVAGLQAAWAGEDRFQQALRSVQAHTTVEEARQRREISSRARQAEQAARTWKTTAYAALVAAIVVLVIAILAVQAAGVEVEPTTSAAAPVVQTIEEPPEANENERIEAALLARAHVIEDCVVSHYDCCVVSHYDGCVECCGKDDGITASGRRATPGVTVAVDPDVIPLGSDVLVDYGDGEIHYYRADDVGGAVQGNHIDLCVESHELASQLGMRTATVYWVEQEEVKRT